MKTGKTRKSKKGTRRKDRTNKWGKKKHFQTCDKKYVTCLYL